MHQSRTHQCQTERSRTDGRIFQLTKSRPSLATASPAISHPRRALATQSQRAPQAQAFLRTPSRIPWVSPSPVPTQLAIHGVWRSPPASNAIAPAASRAALAIPRCFYRLMRPRVGRVPRPLRRIQLPSPVHRLRRTFPSTAISQGIPNHIHKAPTHPPERN